MKCIRVNSFSSEGEGQGSGAWTSRDFVWHIKRRPQQPAATASWPTLTKFGLRLYDNEWPSTVHPSFHPNTPESDRYRTGTLPAEHHQWHAQVPFHPALIPWPGAPPDYLCSPMFGIPPLNTTGDVPQDPMVNAAVLNGSTPTGAPPGRRYERGRHAPLADRNPRTRCIIPRAML